MLAHSQPVDNTERFACHAMASVDLVGRLLRCVDLHPIGTESATFHFLYHTNIITIIIQTHKRERRKQIVTSVFF
jgi:hypothetical protein